MLTYVTNAYKWPWFWRLRPFFLSLLYVCEFFWFSCGSRKITDDDHIMPRNHPISLFKSCCTVHLTACSLPHSSNSTTRLLPPLCPLNFNPSSERRGNKSEDKDHLSLTVVVSQHHHRHPQWPLQWRCTSESLISKPSLIYLRNKST